MNASSDRRTQALLGARGAIALAVCVAALLAYLALELHLGDLVPRAGGARIAADFFGSALRPALDWESSTPPLGATSFLHTVGAALRRTLVFALAALSLALALGLPLGLVASRWQEAGALANTTPARRRIRTLRRSARVLIALLRSVHELVWAVVFLAALGLNSAAAVVAIAIPYAGVLAKVFSELLDEAPPEAARALRAAGLSSPAVFLLGTLPRALPDMTAYAFYRFECATRSAAVLGFFGFPTIGYGIRQSFEDLHYAEVWTQLWALAAVVLLLEAWSAAWRKRFVA